MKLYIPTGCDTVKKFDMETYKLDYIDYVYFESRIIPEDGQFINWDGRKLKVKAGEILHCKGEYICKTKDLDAMLTKYKAERDAKRAEEGMLKEACTSDCVVCESSNN